MERVDEADEEFHGHDATQEEHKVSNEWFIYYYFW